MSIEAKICGINSAEAMAAARDGGAAYAGFIFYPPSPRYVEPETARDLAAEAGGLKTVAVVVDLSDRELEAILKTATVDLIQLHGHETPSRASEIRSKFGLPVMKSISIAGHTDVGRAENYVPVVDRLLFDAKPPQDKADALPGGNALAFDWRLLGGRNWSKPWMLSGGLHAGNIAEAVRISGARAIDVSSGVEDRPGVKNPDKIRDLLAVLNDLQPVA